MSVQVPDAFYVNLIRLNGPGFKVCARTESQCLVTWHPLAIDGFGKFHAGCLL